MPSVTDKLHLDEDTEQSEDVKIERTKEAKTSNMMDSNNLNRAAKKLKTLKNLKRR